MFGLVWFDCLFGILAWWLRVAIFPNRGILPFPSWHTEAGINLPVVVSIRTPRKENARPGSI